MSNTEENWREALTRERRIKICRHIMSKLAIYYVLAPPDSIKQQTRSFEAEAFNHATSRQDYLSKIAEGLTMVETEFSSGRENPPSLLGPAISSSTAQPNTPEPEEGWREAMPSKQRDEQCRHIQSKLATFYENAPPDLLKQNATSFENEVFKEATSRQDYIGKITEILTRVETQVASARGNPVPGQ